MKHSILLTVALICMYYITIIHTDQISDSSRIEIEIRGKGCRNDLKGTCRPKNVPCGVGYLDGPSGQPTCMNSKGRRCCYPEPDYCKKSLQGVCIRPKKACPVGYLPKPSGKPYCTNKRKSKCCYPEPAPPTTTTPPPTTTTPPPTTPAPTTAPPATTVGIQCPDGFCNIEDQCFKIFNSTEVQYGRAKRLCEAEGLKLGEPATNATFIKLAEYARPIHASAPPHYFLGARGDGFGIKWETGPGYVPDNAPWMHDQPEGLSSTWCLDLRTDAVPNTEPLAVFQCDRNHHFICESAPIN